MTDLRERYLTMLKKSLMNILNTDVPADIINPPSFEEQHVPAWFDHYFSGSALTMCSLVRLDNLQFCVEDCLEKGVPGDFIECGVWRGGLTILMRGILAAHGVTDRSVWVADSFQGLRAPPEGSVDQIIYNAKKVIEANRLAVDQATVKANFARYGLLDDQVKFLPGYFSDSLPAAPVERLAVLRLDGDYYESTWDTLQNLYPKLSVNGYVIVDDWGVDRACGAKDAVLTYRKEHGITDEIIPIDWHGSFWKKTR